MARFGALLCGVSMVPFLVLMAHAQPRMMKAEEPDEVGYTSVGAGYFPVPDGAERLKVPNGSFEKVSKGLPESWGIRGFKPMEGDAPDGEVYLEAPAGGPASLSISDLPVIANQAHLVSMWLRTSTPCIAGITSQNASSRFGRYVPRQLPSTDGKWKRVGVYVRILDGTTRGGFTIRVPKGEHGAIAIDDVRLRTATEAEFAKAYAGWRARYPARDISPRPSDGQDLALTIRKFEKGLDPDRPFLIWAIGSSYTNMLGMGETLRQVIGERFPNAPAIVYKKHVGSGSPWHFIRGWVYHKVLPEQPDLVLTYTIGKPEDLEELIQDIRGHCTADIVVPSIHWRMRDAKNWGVSEDALDQPVQAVRDVCKKYGVEFVESRREWEEYMKKYGLKVEIEPEKGLLKDAVHQSDYGALIINENIARHFAKAKSLSYDPEGRERRLCATDCTSIRANEKIDRDSAWRTTGKTIHSSSKAAKVKVTFQGNRIDVIGVKSPQGGTAKVLIDGRSGGAAAVFFQTYIQPGPKNAKPGRGMTADRSPHWARLGKDIVPQKWTITMTSDTGDFRLEGSVTGADGEGNNQELFTSRSGQIILDPKFWRRSKDRKGVFSNKTGDVWTFEVYRAAVGEVSFKGSTGERFRAKLAQALPNTEHTLELIANGDGEIAIEAFDVFEPPLK